MKLIQSNLAKPRGEGKVVEVDEANFEKKKYNRGRVIEGQWLFDGMERVSRRIFTVPVKDRSAQTHISIIIE